MFTWPRGSMYIMNRRVPRTDACGTPQVGRPPASVALPPAMALLVNHQTSPRSYLCTYQRGGHLTKTSHVDRRNIWNHGVYVLLSWGTFFTIGSNVAFLTVTFTHNYGAEIREQSLPASKSDMFFQLFPGPRAKDTSGPTLPLLLWGTGKAEVRKTKLGLVNCVPCFCRSRWT